MFQKSLQIGLRQSMTKLNKKLPEPQNSLKRGKSPGVRSKKSKAKTQKSVSPKPGLKRGAYDAFKDEAFRVDGEIYDYDAKPHNEIVLVDTDGDDLDVVVISDPENNDDILVIDAPPPKRQKLHQSDIARNLDFIGLGGISSDEEAYNGDDADDNDGYNSVDENGIVYRKLELSSKYPWVRQHDHSKQKEVADWLTMEMKDFVGYISPSSHEIHSRNKVVNRLKKCIKTFWPDTEAHVFGSCATDLYLPGSDIDMVVVSTSGNYEERSKLYQLSSHLRSQQLARNMEVISKAKVPIIKFVDPESGIHIDISFERTNGILAAKKIRLWLEATPGLREIVLIVKQFLRSRKLNNVHVGGLGGYATIILCYHFLKMHPRIATNTMSTLDNLGSLLIEFFELYGRNFSYEELIIALDPDTDEPKYLRKSHYPALSASRNPFAITIQDPSDASNNITRSSFNLRDLKKAFNGAYQMLTEKCYELNSATYKERLGALILGDVVKYLGKERDFNDDRHKVANHALVKHDGESDHEDSDGHDGNHKYYLSDMTDESESEGPTLPANNDPVATKRKVSNYLGLEDGEKNDSEEREDSESSDERGSKNSVDKGIKREYWSQKGLVLS